MRKRLFSGSQSLGSCHWLMVRLGEDGSDSAERHGAAARHLQCRPQWNAFSSRPGRRSEHRKDKVNRKFEVKTLEPLESTNGSVIPSGTRIRGHISRIEPAGTTGRARIWLTFDEIDTHHGRLPLIAFVSSVPGEFSVKPVKARGRDRSPHQQGNPRSRSGRRRSSDWGHRGAKATHSGKGAPRELRWGIAGFLASSGFGQELDLRKGTKLDLVLDRPLYLN